MTRQPFARLVLAAVLAGFLATPAARGQTGITLGNVVVLRVGPGNGAGGVLDNSATPAALLEFTTATPNQLAPVQAIALPSTTADAIRLGGSNDSEGLITLSGDRTRIVVPGYNATMAVAGVSGTTSATVNRVGGAVTVATGQYAEAYRTTSQFNSGNHRSGWTPDGVSYYAGGSGVTNSGGVNLFDAANPNGVRVSAGTATEFTNIRGVQGFNGDLYYATGAGNRGLYRFTGLPTSSTAPTRVIDLTGGTPNAFAVSPTGTTVYIADDRTSGTGGLQKWQFNGTNWALTGNLIVGGAGVRGLAVDFSGVNPVLFATTTETNANRLVRVIDDGMPFAGLTPVTLATADSNTAFRGVVFVPVPEPGTVLGVAALGLGVACAVRRRLRRSVPNI